MSDHLPPPPFSDYPPEQERADVQTIRETLDNVAHGPLCGLDACPGCEARAALDSLAARLRAGDSREEWLTAQLDKQTANVGELLTKLQTAEEERDGAIAALDRETRALYDEIERYRAALAAPSVERADVQTIRAGLARPRTHEGETCNCVDCELNAKRHAALDSLDASLRAAEEDRREVEVRARDAYKMAKGWRCECFELGGGFVNKCRRCLLLDDLSVIRGRSAALAAASTEGAATTCSECGRDLHGYHGPKCRYCDGTAE